MKLQKFISKKKISRAERRRLRRIENKQLKGVGLPKDWGITKNK